MVSPDPDLDEYFTLVKSVSEFDQRLLTVKSWGVTVSLATLGFGFQYRSYGLFLVAAASSLAFWSLEGTIKRHQMRYYPRMREIEVNRYLRAGEKDRAFSAPRIDWSWARSDRLFRGLLKDPAAPPEPSIPSTSYGRAWLLLHVAMPHVITLMLGVLLFGLGYFGYLRGFELGSVKASG
jgi:hypothetical protein